MFDLYLDSDFDVCVKQNMLTGKEQYRSRHVHDLSVCLCHASIVTIFVESGPRLMPQVVTPLRIYF